MASVEGHMNGLVKEYLECYGFHMTLEKFIDECSQKSQQIDSVEKTNTTQKINIVINDMLHLFHEGQRQAFFKRWLETVPAQQVNDYEQQEDDAEDPSMRRLHLELELNIHFTLFPFRSEERDLKAQRDGIAAFKEFMEAKSDLLCRNKEFLQYFSLPYQTNPREAFPQVFTSSWMKNLEARLEQFLKSALKTQSQPRLVDLCTNFDEKVHEDSAKSNALLRQQIAESEKRTMSFMRKFHRVNADYHSIIGLAAELVDSLESSISGSKPITSEYIQDISKRLINIPMAQSVNVDVTRPGTAGDMIRKSIAYHKVLPDKSEVRKSFPPLNFAKIRRDLTNGAPGSEKRKLLLLQALRWRLTKSEATETRQHILTGYIAGDLLNCHSERVPNTLIELIKSPSELVRQFMARLINTFSSLNHGRSYLASNLEIVKCMLAVLRVENVDNDTQQNLLGALQKLSLRQKLQMQMINDNVIELLIDLLEHSEKLSNYSYEYAIALVMNLSLRTVGKKKCLNDYKRIIAVLSTLISNENSEIQTYVNGTLYSILHMHVIRQHARSVNLVSVIKSYMIDGAEDTNGQRKMIIDKINSEDESDTLEEQNFEEEEDDEEDVQKMEPELDHGELLFKLQPNELNGEQLLLAEYSMLQAVPFGGGVSGDANRPTTKPGSEFISESPVLCRPITPLSTRQSQQFQSSIIGGNTSNSSNNNNNNNNSRSIQSAHGAANRQEAYAASNARHKSSINLNLNNNYGSGRAAVDPLSNINNQSVAKRLPSNEKKTNTPHYKQTVSTPSGDSVAQARSLQQRSDNFGDDDDNYVDNENGSDVNDRAATAAKAAKATRAPANILVIDSTADSFTVVDESYDSKKSFSTANETAGFATSAIITSAMATTTARQRMQRTPEPVAHVSMSSRKASQASASFLNASSSSSNNNNNGVGATGLFAAPKYSSNEPRPSSANSINSKSSSSSGTMGTLTNRQVEPVAAQNHNAQPKRTTSATARN